MLRGVLLQGRDFVPVFERWFSSVGVRVLVFEYSRAFIEKEWTNVRVQFDP